MSWWDAVPANVMQPASSPGSPYCFEGMRVCQAVITKGKAVAGVKQGAEDAVAHHDLGAP